jgi:PmbA protein
MEQILEKAKKVAEEAEIYQVSSEETQVRFEANKLKQLQTKQQTSVALRIIKNGKTGYATSTEIGDGQELVNNALETAGFGTKAGFRLPERTEYPPVDIYDDAVNSVSTKEMIGLGEEMIGTITRHTPKIVGEGAVSRSVINVSIINSRGGQAAYRKSFFGLEIEGSLIEATDILFVGESQNSCHPLSDTSSVTDEVLHQLDLAKNRAIAPSKRLPVVFTPNGIASGLLLPLMSAFNGKTVLEGASPIGNKQGQPVFDRQFNLYDDPTISYRPGSRPCDDEGVGSQRTTLVKEGVVSDFLYDLQTAALAGKQSTGNGSRGRGGPPSPSASAFTIAPGDTTFDDMIKDIKEGLLVDFLMGASQGNVLGGDFSGNVLLGYKIENGEIVGRVKDTMISGNIYKALKDIAAIGSQARWVGSSLLTPPIYLPAVAVASKG